MLNLILRTLFSAKKSRQALILENIALRNQIEILQRTSGRPTLRWRDRAFWDILSCLWPDWRRSMYIAQPETVMANLPDQSCIGHRLDRFLHPTFCHLPSSVRLPRPGQRKTEDHPFQCHHEPDCDVDRPANRRGFPMGNSSKISHPRSRRDLRLRFHTSGSVSWHRANPNRTTVSLAEPVRRAIEHGAGPIRTRARRTASSLHEEGRVGASALDRIVRT